jgi:hypothetical protein
MAGCSWQDGGLACSSGVELEGWDMDGMRAQAGFG